MNFTAVAIVAISCWALVEVVQTLTNRKHKAKNANIQQDQQAMQKALQELRDRVEVLEKIVTDEKYDLNKQFEDLKKDKVA